MRGWLVNPPAKGGRGLSCIRRRLIIPAKEGSGETVPLGGTDNPKLSRWEGQIHMETVPLDGRNCPAGRTKLPQTL